MDIAIQYPGEMEYFSLRNSVYYTSGIFDLLKRPSAGRNLTSAEDIASVYSSAAVQNSRSRKKPIVISVHVQHIVSL